MDCSPSNQLCRFGAFATAGSGLGVPRPFRNRALTYRVPRLPSFVPFWTFMPLSSSLAIQAAWQMAQGPEHRMPEPQWHPGWSVQERVNTSLSVSANRTPAQMKPAAAARRTSPRASFSSM
ncbi:hypothetical protein Mnod_6882 [Methylobacterium nodulans ORS 2060]|uniref:Uncharacterized protein n=1 Tax=Methylobacterium nodulans (strain LMG 21967 / CNCM I-2342 / ORS 2060) TaxID=460265 RepID=B8IHG4_METNO|nr:hypothetical protein Mnod_6882 [Methylobacterium nodulans ORS 2060]